MAPYRPPGRSNRSGRAQADNDIFEGLPVKQWSHTTSRISLAPPVTEVRPEQGQDRWALEPPMPRDYQLLQPYTQQLLRLARSGKVGQKRKSARENAEAQGEDDDGRDEEANHNDEANGPLRNGLLDEERAFFAKKWKHVPDHALVPEHLHWEFLAKRRKGLPSFYYGNADGFGAPVSLRKTRVWKVVDAVTGDVAVYDVLAPEGQTIENEIVAGSELADKEPTTVAPGTVVDGIGIANDDGVLVIEFRNPAVMAQRRNRPPPKKKGGPGRGKKRVTFTNPDGSTYTTVVPNATKIVPQPGQTVKHVAKGEEAARDISAEEAAKLAKAAQGSQAGDDDDEDEGEDEEGDEDDDDGEEGADGDQEEGEHVDGDTTMQDDAADQEDSEAQNGTDAHTEHVTELADDVMGDTAAVPEAISDLDGSADAALLPVSHADTDDGALVTGPNNDANDATHDSHPEAATNINVAMIESASEAQPPESLSAEAAGRSPIHEPAIDSAINAVPVEVTEEQLAESTVDVEQQPADTEAAPVEQPMILPGITHTMPLVENQPDGAGQDEASGP